jgi:tRNA U55 pseudouridine synthase TruB
MPDTRIPYKTEHIKSPVPSALRRQARQGRRLKISARAIGETGLASRKSAGKAIRSAQVRIKAAKKGVYVGTLHSELAAQKSVRSHASPLRKLEQKVRKIARKFDPIAKKKLPRGPRNILGGFAVPGIVKKITDRVRTLQMKGQEKRLKEGGFVPKGGGEA